MKENYAKAYKEVCEILKYMPQESVNKIPQNILDMFKNKMDMEHQFQVDVNKDIKQQNMLEETKAILANFYEDYWATDEEKAEIKKRDLEELQKIEEEKRKKYNVDVFATYKNRDNSLKSGSTSPENKNSLYESNNLTNMQESNAKDIKSKQLPVEIKEGFFEKIKSFFMGLFRK